MASLAIRADWWAARAKKDQIIFQYAQVTLTAGFPARFLRASDNKEILTFNDPRFVEEHVARLGALIEAQAKGSVPTDYDAEATLAAEGRQQVHDDVSGFISTHYVAPEDIPHAEGAFRLQEVLAAQPGDLKDNVQFLQAVPENWTPA